MKNYQKIIVVFIGGGISWAMAYCASIWPDYAFVMASLSSASTAMVGITVGWTPEQPVE